MRHDQERAIRLDVALTPLELSQATPAVNTRVAIVVDVIRATTTLAMLFDQGCRRVLLAPDIQAARAARLSRPESLLAGEVGGAAPPGFDLGNSPTEVSAHDVRGREIVFATTNGTRALRACGEARVTFAGSLRNATAVSRAALASLQMSSSATPQVSREPSSDTISAGEPSEALRDDFDYDILVVCSGRGQRPAYDDTVCAGYLCERIVGLASAMGLATGLGEGARVALSTWRDAQASGPLETVLAQSDAARAIAAIGLLADLEWCAALDASSSIPWVVGQEEPELLVMEPWTGAMA